MTTPERFAQLSKDEQFSAIEKLGREALRQLGVEPTEVARLVHLENTTFRVESPQGRFCLRVSRPGYQSTSNIRSEIHFLTAMRQAGFHVPEPYIDDVISASAPEVPEPRDCVLLRWQEGKFANAGFTPNQAFGLGRMIAEFHNFATTWTPPSGFDRQFLYSWTDKPGMPPAIDRPSSIDEDHRALLLKVTAEAREMLTSLPRDAANYGLIHADLHRGNVLFEGDEPNAIDFDDLSYGFWLNDFASALAYEVPRDEYEAVRDAMLHGYEEVRPLPPGTAELLAPFIRMRLAGVSTWVVSRTDNPDMLANAPKWVAGMCASILKLA